MFVYLIGPLFMLNIGYVIMAVVDILAKKFKKRVNDKKLADAQLAKQKLKLSKPLEEI